MNKEKRKQITMAILTAITIAFILGTLAGMII